MGRFPNQETQFKEGNPGGGRPKGSLNWSTIVKAMLEDEQFADKVVAKKPGWWESLPNKDMAHIIAGAMMTAAISGSHKAAEWVRKTGFGDKLEIDENRTETRIVEIYDMTPTKDENSEQAEAGS